RTRFQSDIQDGVVESPGTQRLRGLRDGDHLGVGGRVQELFALIVGRTDHTALQQHDDRPHRDFVLGKRGRCLIHGQRHMFEVKRMPRVGQREIKRGQQESSRSRLRPNGLSLLNYPRSALWWKPPVASIKSPLVCTNRSREIQKVSVLVQKFGGTSVKNAERIMAAARRAIAPNTAGHQRVVVASARGDTTDELIEWAREIAEQPPAREMDMLLATGEQISIALMAMAIHTLGENAISFTGTQVGIVTDSTHTKARIKSISTQRLRRALNAGRIVIVAGFQGIDEEGNITTLGRGGSDTTAVALAAVLKHDGAGDADVGCEIYTDVDGVYTTDPRPVPEARKMDFISYDEMIELASAGAAGMHSRAVEFAKKYHVPVIVRRS